jgi:hypothetical protein
VLSNANLLQVLAYLRNLEPSANVTVLPDMQDFPKLDKSNKGYRISVGFAFVNSIFNIYYQVLYLCVCYFKSPSRDGHWKWAKATNTMMLSAGLCKIHMSCIGPYQINPNLLTNHIVWHCVIFGIKNVLFVFVYTEYLLYCRPTVKFIVIIVHFTSTISQKLKWHIDRHNDHTFYSWMKPV